MSYQIINNILSHIAIVYYNKQSNGNVVLQYTYEDMSVSAACKECKIIQKIQTIVNQTVINDELDEFCKDHRHEDGLKREYGQEQQ